MALFAQAPSDYCPTFGGESASAQSLESQSPQLTINSAAGGRASRPAVPALAEHRSLSPSGGRSPPASGLQTAYQSPPTTSSWTIEKDTDGSDFTGKNSAQKRSENSYTTPGRNREGSELSGWDGAGLHSWGANEDADNGGIAKNLMATSGASVHDAQSLKNDPKTKINIQNHHRRPTYEERE